MKNRPKQEEKDSNLYGNPTFDLERMKKALASERIEVPNNLSRQELIEFITKAANQVNQNTK